MTKFNVGDKVRVIVEDHPYFKNSHIFIVDRVDGMGDVYNENGICVLKDRVELVVDKPTKNQRITTLENEVAELKLIVHELRGKKSIEPSTTNTVEDIIEFEGQQYRKVDREACEGDVVIVKRTSAPEWVTIGKSYKAFMSGDGSLDFKDDLNQTVCVYDGFKTKHTKEDIDVYELIEEGLNPQIPMEDETIEPLTPNQQRAAIIEKAKKFVEENKVTRNRKDIEIKVYINRKTLNWVNAEFIVNEEKKTIVCLVRWTQDKSLDGRGIAKCNPNDVFNEHIGKAIALGRALGLDVSEFEQVVQPIEIVNGMEIMLFNSDGKDHKSGVVETYNSTADEATFSAEKTYGPYAEKTGFSRCIREHGYKILNDTNAIYGGVE